MSALFPFCESVLMRPGVEVPQMLGSQGPSSTRYSGSWLLEQQEIWCSYVFFQPLATLSQWGSSMEVMQLLRSWGPGQCQATGTGGYCHRSYGDIRAFSSIYKFCPSEDSAWRWHSYLIVGTLAGPSVQGHRLPQPWELWP